MYTDKNFRTKKELKEAVARGEKVTIFSPGLGVPPLDGTCSVEGPHHPEPHKWYATVTLEKGVVTRVK